jgi:hypothetical protein
MAKKTNSSAALDFAFFNYLWAFYETNKGTIRKSYKELSKKFLDYTILKIVLMHSYVGHSLKP